MRIITVFFCLLILCVGCKQSFHYCYTNNQVLYPEVEGGDTLIVIDATNLNRELDDRKAHSYQFDIDILFRKYSYVDNTPRNYSYQIDGIDTIWHK